MRKVKLYKPELVNQWKLVKSGETNLLSIASVDITKDTGYAQGDYYRLHFCMLGFCVSFEVFLGW